MEADAGGRIQQFCLRHYDSEAAKAARAERCTIYMHDGQESEIRPTDAMRTYTDHVLVYGLISRETDYQTTLGRGTEGLTYVTRTDGHGRDTSLTVCTDTVETWKHSTCVLRDSTVSYAR